MNVPSYKEIAPIRCDFFSFQVKTPKYACPEMCWSYIDTCVSGSPILQNGRLIGAVTHVLVNDPTMGYGIFIESMLDAAA